MRYDLNLNNETIVENIVFNNEQVSALRKLSGALEKRNVLFRIVESKPIEVHHTIDADTYYTEREYGPQGGLETALNMAERSMRKSHNWSIVFDGFEEFGGLHKRVKVLSTPLKIEDGVIGFATELTVGSKVTEFDYDLNSSGNFINKYKEYVLRKVKERI